MSVVWAFSIYALTFFVFSFSVMEAAGFYLYDEKPKYAFLRCLGGSLILAALATYTHPSFDKMFIEKLGATVISGIIWVGVFMFIYSFHPWHALGIGLAVMVISTGLASMAVDSFNVRDTRPIADIRKANKAFRQSMPAGPVAPPTPPENKPAEPAKK